MGESEQQGLRPNGSGLAHNEQLKKSLEFQTRLNRVTQELFDADDLVEVFPKVLPDLLILLRAERLTIYTRSRDGREIVSKFKAGDAIKEIRVPLSNTSISGYVALTQRMLRIADVYDADELKAIHPKLHFDSSFDKKSGFRTRSMIVLPIKHKEVFLGVMQVLNRFDGQPFSDNDVKVAMRLSQVFGQKLRYEVQSTSGPYDYLITLNKLSRDQLDTFQSRATKERTSVTQLLLSEAGVLPAELGASLEKFYGVPFMTFDRNLDLPSELMVGLSDVYLRKQLWVPVGWDGKEAVILIDDPTDTQRIMEIQRVVRAETYSFRVGLPDDILRFLGVEAAEEGTADISDLVGQLAEEGGEVEDIDEGKSEVNENEATVIKLVNRLITDAYKMGASDIHIEPSKGRVPAVVRLRVDGSCRPTLQIPATHVKAVVSRIKVMSKLDISERRKPQDGKLVVRYRGAPVELRVATLPTVHGESVVMRILAASEPLPLDKLNLNTWNEENLKAAVAHPHGIFLVVGPTGSGKTTTLHSVLGYINTPDRKIWTAEDPVEITQPGLQQMQMQPKIGLTFAAALRAFLRADPDVIMIGEMRDAETAEAGVEASLTGHLVFSTLHTNSAPETVVRLLDLGLDPVSFADAFLGVLAQRLARTLCKECKAPYQASEEEIKRIKHFYGEQYWPELGVDESNVTLHKPVGCEKCDNTGYKGRTGLHELLIATPEVTDLIYHKATATQIKEQGVSQGMRTLMQDGIQKLLKGQLDFDMLRKVVAE